MITDDLTQTIIAAAFKVHNTLGGGFLEKVYENALAIELRKRGLEVVQQYPIDVFYEEELVGTYSADLWVENCMIVELKAVENLTKIFELQIINYLAATGLDVGLLVNFGSSVTIKRKYRNYTPKNNPLY
jgi:GxxExxY protein